MSDELEGTYWWCLKHSRVERFEDTDSIDRLGPYPDAATAEAAVQRIAEREKRLEKEDSEWEGDE